MKNTHTTSTHSMENNSMNTISIITKDPIMNTNTTDKENVMNTDTNTDTKETAMNSDTNTDMEKNTSTVEDLHYRGIVACRKQGCSPCRNDESNLRAINNPRFHAAD